MGPLIRLIWLRLVSSRYPSVPAYLALGWQVHHLHLAFTNFILLFTSVLGIGFKSSCLYSKCFTHWDSPQPFTFLSEVLVDISRKSPCLPPVFSVLLLVIANLGCQFDHICYQLNSRHLGIWERDFLDWIFWGGMTHSKSTTSSGGRLHERTQQKEVCTFCLLALMLAGNFPDSVAVASPHWH